MTATLEAPAAVTTVPQSGIPVVYGITAADIEAKRERYGALQATTPAGYEEVRIARRDCVSTRTAIEARRKQLKADSLDFGRRVDSVAKELTALVESIERPLDAKIKAIDDEKARVRREAEEAKRREVQAKIDAEVNVVTVDGHLSETLDGDTAIDLTAHVAEWRVIAVQMQVLEERNSDDA